VHSAPAVSQADEGGKEDGDSPAEAPQQAASLGSLEGKIVRVRGQSASRLGTIRHSDGDMHEVVFVDVPGRRESVESLSSSELQLVALADGQTVLLRTNPFGFVPATHRVTEGDAYLLEIPSGEGSRQNAQFPKVDALVRDGSDFDHPVDALAAGLVDRLGPYLARKRALHSFTRQRAACRGLTALMSAAVEPFRHQVNVLAQVMSDPVRRYVLADEVGLGKTIEAGLVIRQILLDDPKSEVLISVPTSLIGQWQRELREKLLLLGPAFETRYSVVSHDDLPLTQFKKYDLLVIDEAHQVAELALTDSDEAQIIQHAAASVPGLLLLTATPIRGNAEVFHYLLHLVDPLSHPLDDLEGFQNRLELREQQAFSIETLKDPNMPWELTKNTLEEFAETYSSDAYLQKLIKRALKKGEGGASSDLEDLATYLRDTYRLSRRVIRNRRSGAPEFKVAGRLFKTVEFDDPATIALEGFLDLWREALQGEPDSVQERAVSERSFAEAVDAATAGPIALDKYLESLTGERSGAEKFAIDNLKVALEQEGVGPEKRAEKAVEWLAEFWSKGKDQVVVATSYTSVAEDLIVRLTKRIGPTHVVAHLRSATAANNARAISEFSEGRRFIIVDDSGEEGHNFQHASVLFHLDVPLSINRFEQRIGRLDRYTAEVGVGLKKNYLLTAQSEWESNRDELHHVVGVREQSVATLQLPLAALEGTLSTRMLAEGSTAFPSLCPGLAEQLQEESDQLSRLEDLESFAGRVGFSFNQFAEIGKIENDWRTVERAVRSLVKELGFRVKEGDAPPGVCEFSLLNRDQLPCIPKPKLQEVAPMLTGRRSFNRAVSVKNPNVSLVRVGDPMVDWLDTYLGVDERGRTRAVIRHCPGLELPELWFQFDLLLELSTGESKPDWPVATRELRRTGDRYLAPKVYVRWSDGQQSPDAEFRETHLENDLKGNQRVVYGPLWSTVLDLFPDYSELTIGAFEQAKEQVASKRESQEETETALAELKHDFDASLRSLKRVREIDAQRHSEIDAEIKRLKWLKKKIRSGIEEPSLRCMSAGAYILVGGAS